MAAGKILLFYDPVISRPTFWARFCHKFCDLYASIYGNFSMTTTSSNSSSENYKWKVMEHIHQHRSCWRQQTVEAAVYVRAPTDTSQHQPPLMTCDWTHWTSSSVWCRC